MTYIDLRLQAWRIAKARPFIKPGARVLDIGCADGSLFKQLQKISSESLGIDPTLKANTYIGGVPLVAGYFPKDVPQGKSFDVVTMLAVLEHFPEAVYTDLASGCARFLKPNGHLIITVPSPMVDYLLEAMKFFRLIDGMSLEEHHGFKVGETTAIFPASDFRLLVQKRFQLGMNNLFVFQRR